MTHDGRGYVAKTVGLMGIGLLAMVAFYNVGEQYNGFRQVFGVGTCNIPAQELVFFIWYAFLGVIATAAIAIALSRTALTDCVLAHGERLLSRRSFGIIAITVLFLEIVCVRLLLLKDMPIADDEETYRFIAKTLLQGRIANPVPPGGAFFENQFVIVSSSLWYGKYPIGYPLLLALGEAIGLRVLVTPIITCGTAYLTFVVTKRLLSRQAAALVLLLLIVSPQFVCMGATDLSQPASSLLMMAGVYALLRLDVAHNYYLRALLVGTAFAALLWVRPFPGILMVGVVGVYVLIGTWRCSNGGLFFKRMPWLILMGVPILAAMVGLLWLNRSLTGDAMTTGYHAASAAAGGSAVKSGASGLGFITMKRGIMSTSLFGGILRFNFWLLGWPLSIVFLVFAKWNKKLGLIWGLLSAVLAYRILVPKTVVSTVGPVYFTEAIPLVLLLSVSGIDVCAALFGRLDINGRRAVSSVAAASFIVGAVCFMPPMMRDVGASSALRFSLLEHVRGAAGTHAVVFARFLVDPKLESTWAPHPPNSDPSLDGPILWVRPKTGIEGAKENMAFLKTHFPSRQGFYLTFSSTGPMLKRVTHYKDFLINEK